MKSNLTEVQKVLLSIEYFNDKYNYKLKPSQQTKINE